MGKIYRAAEKIKGKIRGVAREMRYDAEARRKAKFAKEEREIQEGKAAIKHHRALAKVRAHKRKVKYGEGLGGVLSNIFGTASGKKGKPRKR